MEQLVVAGYSVRRLSASDAGELQELFEHCSDYHEMYDGTPTRAGAGQEALSGLPAGKDLSDKFALGIYAPAGRLIGYLELMRDFPVVGEWWIGLLMLDPQERGTALGARTYEAAAEWVAAQGAGSISLGVLERNPRAERFWRRLGFQEVRRQPYTTPAGYRGPGEIIVMRHLLTRGTPLPPGGR